MIDFFISFADLLSSYGLPALATLAVAAVVTVIYGWKPEFLKKVSAAIFASGPALLALFDRLKNRKNTGA